MFIGKSPCFHTWKCDDIRVVFHTTKKRQQKFSVAARWLLIFIHTHTHTHTLFLFADESESESELEEDGGGGGDPPLKTMEEKLRDLNTAHDLVVKNSHQLMRLITEGEEGGVGKPNCAKLKEKLTLFKLTTTAMVKVRAVFFANLFLQNSLSRHHCS